MVFRNMCIGGLRNDGRLIKMVREVLIGHRKVLKLLRVLLHPAFLDGALRVESVNVASFRLTLTANSTDRLFLRIGGVLATCAVERMD